MLRLVGVGLFVQKIVKLLREEDFHPHHRIFLGILRIDSREHSSMNAIFGVLLYAAGQECNHVDATGCRAHSDIVGQEKPLVNMTLDEQIAQCAKLCCANSQCDA